MEREGFLSLMRTAHCATGRGEGGGDQRDLSNTRLPSTANKPVENVLQPTTIIQQFQHLTALPRQDKATSLESRRRCSLKPFYSHKGMKKKKPWILFIFKKKKISRDFQSSQASNMHFYSLKVVN